MSMVQNNLSSELISELVEICQSLHKTFKLHGLIDPPPVNYYLSKADASLLKPESVNQAIVSAKDYSETLDSALQAGIKLKKGKEFTRFWLKRMNLKCSDKFLNEMVDDDTIIEGYTKEHVQSFRNLAFMGVCGYSLAEILLYPWQDLFERSNHITSICVEDVVASMESLNIETAHAPDHFMKERFSFDRRVHKISFKNVCPIMHEHTNELYGYFVSAKGTIVDKNPDRHELRFI